MKNRLYLIAATIVVGLAYLINAQEKAPAPPPEEAAKPAVVEVAPAPAAEPAVAPAMEPVPVAEPKPVSEPTVAAEPAKPEEVKPATEPKPAEVKPAETKPAVMPAVEPAKTNEAEFVSLPDEPEKAIPGSVVQLNTNETLSIALDDVDMADVIRMFTRLSKANIIANPSNLTGKVTVNLQDVEWRPALTSILDMHSLQLVEKTPASGVYSIVPKQPGAPEPLIVETMFLKYASVSNVESVVRAIDRKSVV